MTNTKRILSCILALCLILSMLPMSVFAADEYTLSEDGTLTITVDISSYTTIPWQNEREQIKNVVFQADITALPERAFDHCTALESIVIPDSITSIGNGAFDYCTALESISIPDSVTSIGNGAFSNCNALSSVTFEGNSSLETIGERAFSNCTALESIVIPDSVTSIGNFAFYYCTALESIVIPNSVTSIGNFAFYHCDALTDVYYEGTVESWNSITKGTNAIPDGVKINHTGSCVDDDTNHICDLCGTAVPTCTDFAEVVKPEALKSAADCTNPAVYYKSCTVCGANGSETFTNGEANGHNYTYTASGNVISESCICGHSETATITAPENPVYDGTPKEATVTYTDNWQGGELTIAYSDGGNVNAGSVTTSIEKDGETASVEYEIAKARIDKPTDDTTEFVYNGSEQTYTVAENDKYEVSGNKLTNAGSQDVTIAIKDKANFEWADGTTDDVTFTFTIAQATPIAIDGSVTKASSIRKNNKLSASAITGGKYKGILDVELEGTYAWREPDKEMTADSKEIVVFTPNNTNYAPVEIEVDVDVAVYRSSSSGRGVSHYTVKFETNGGTKIAYKTVTGNSRLAEPEAPTKDGYTFDGWYTDEELTEKYDFDKAVTKGFTLYAKWVSVGDDAHIVPSDDETDGKTDTPDTPVWENPFEDVKPDDWYYEDARYAVENGLMGGTTTTTFAPDGIITRAMMVTVLYRAEGEPAVGDGVYDVPPFADVDMGAYYANAVIWAKQNGIVKGVSETEFAPDQNIIREQIAAIMHRYAQYKGYDVSVGENTNILSYTDFDSISEYAIASMQYAVGSGILRGKTDTTLNPQDNATRAEIAAMLHRFIEANK